MGTTANWVSNYLLQAIFLPITSTETGKIIAYCLLAGSCFLTFAFVYRFVPETKGFSLEQCVQFILAARRRGCKDLVGPVPLTMGSMSSAAVGDQESTRGLLDVHGSQQIQMAESPQKQLIADLQG